MKSFIYLTSIVTTVTLLCMPGSVLAQSIFGQNFSNNGYSSTTIYIPSTQTITTTTIDRVNSNIYPSNSSFINSKTSYSTGDYPLSHHRQHRQPKAILQPQTIYPLPVRAHCTTSIIGSPIPSPIPLNSVTGQFCN